MSAELPPPSQALEGTEAALDELLSRTGADFVRQAYRVILGREADPGGFVEYLGKLHAGASRRDVVEELRSSPEGLRRPMAPGLSGAQQPAPSAPRSVDELLAHEGAGFVKHTYALLLGRAADPSGLVHYVGMLERGVRREQVLAEIASSDEYRQRNLPVAGVERFVAQHQRLRHPLLRAAARLVLPRRSAPPTAAPLPAPSAPAAEARGASTDPVAKPANPVRTLLLTLPTLEQRRTRPSR